MRVLLSALAFLLMTLTPVCAAGECTLEPLPPLPPLGCKSLSPVCMCDQEGNYRWEYVCVRY